MFIQALQSNSLDTINEYSRNVGDFLFMEMLMLYGTFDMFKYVVENKIIKCDTSTLFAVIGFRSEKWISLIIQQDISYDIDDLIKLLIHCRSELVKNIYEKQPYPDPRLARLAAIYGNYDLLIWFHQRGCQLTPECYNFEDIFTNYSGEFESYGENGELYSTWDDIYKGNWNKYLINLQEVYRYLHDQACDWDEIFLIRIIKICNNVSRHYDGDISEFTFGLIQFLHENNCPWSERCCIAAIEGSWFELMKFMIDNGCPFGIKSYVAACMHWIRMIDKDFFEYFNIIFPFSNSPIEEIINHLLQPDTSMHLSNDEIYNRDFIIVFLNLKSLNNIIPYNVQKEIEVYSYHLIYPTNII